MFDVDLKKTAPNMRDLVSYTGLGCWGLGGFAGALHPWPPDLLRVSEIWSGLSASLLVA